MNNKKFTKLLAYTSLISLVFIVSINYVVDPYGRNNKFVFKGNVDKVVRDERSRKFDLLLNNPDASSFIFGTSRALVLDADKLGMITKTEALNLAFSNASVDEYYLFIKYLLETRKVSNIIIGIDLFSYTENYMTNGVMPPELLEYFNMASSYAIKSYLSSKMFRYSIETLFRNYISKIKPKHYYTKRGKIIKKRYLKAKESQGALRKHTNEYVINDLPHWNSKNSGISKKQLNYLNDIKNMCKKHDVKLKLFMSPLYIKQIKVKGDRFIEQQKLLSFIVNNISPVYDYNSIDNININPYSFSDGFHYSYDIADMIIEDIYLNSFEDNINYISKEKINRYTEIVNQKLFN